MKDTNWLYLLTVLSDWIYRLYFPTLFTHISYCNDFFVSTECELQQFNPVHHLCPSLPSTHFHHCPDHLYDHPHMLAKVLVSFYVQTLIIVVLVVSIGCGSPSSQAKPQLWLTECQLPAPNAIAATFVGWTWKHIILCSLTCILKLFSTQHSELTGKKPVMCIQIS